MFKFCYSEFLTNVSLLKYRIQYRHKKSVIRFIGLTKISQRSVSGKLHEFKKKKKKYSASWPDSKISITRV